MDFTQNATYIIPIHTNHPLDDCAEAEDLRLTLMAGYLWGGSMGEGYDEVLDGCQILNRWGIERYYVADPAYLPSNFGRE